MTCSWTHLKPKKWSSVAQIRLPYPFSLNSSWSNPTRHYCTFKLLGLHLDASLSWTTHINTVRCIQSQQKTVLPQTTEESRRPTPTTPTTPLLHYSNPPSSRVCLPSLALLHHSRAILPTGINPKTSSIHIIFSDTRGMSYPNVLFVANLNSLKDRRDRLSRSFSILFANQIPVSTTFFHLPATLPSFPDCVLPHLSLAQSHEQKSFNHF